MGLQLMREVESNDQAEYSFAVWLIGVIKDFDHNLDLVGLIDERFPFAAAYTRVGWGQDWLLQQIALQSAIDQVSNQYPDSFLGSF
jgi:hypothetical protein